MRIPHKQFDQVVFPVAQRAGFRSDAKGAAAFIQRQVSQRSVFPLVVLSAAGQCVYPHPQLLQGKGFGQVVIASAFKACHLVADFTFGSQQQNRRCVSFPAKRTQHRQSIRSRHHDIQDKDIMAGRTGHFQGIRSVVRPVHLIVVVFQIGDYCLGHRLFVFRKKKPHPHHPLESIIHRKTVVGTQCYSIPPTLSHSYVLYAVKEQFFSLTGGSS